MLQRGYKKYSLLQIILQHQWYIITETDVMGNTYHQEEKLSLGLIKHHAIKIYGGVEVQPHHSWPQHNMEVKSQL
jgi:hypothetical protein